MARQPASLPVIAIFGPTASGKSAVALALAELVGGEIVSCDSMQLYRGLPLLSNQPGPDELARVPHHLVAIWPLEHEASVAEYAALAHAATDGIAAAGRVPVLAGGSGLYLRAALAELRLPPPPRPGERERLVRVYDRLGPERAYELLRRRDPRAAAAVHPNDRRRVVRALELERAGASLAPETSLLWSGPLRRPALVAAIELPAAELRERIARRSAAMFERGVEEEVRAARAAQQLSATAERMLGLAEVEDVIAGRLDRERALERLTARSARYAKRQRTWLRRLPGCTLLDGRRPAAELAASLVALARSAADR